MRHLTAAISLLVLSACVAVADRSSLRPPQTPEEVAAFNRVSLPVGRATAALEAGNADLCSGRCDIRVWLAVADGIGAWATTKEISITIAMVEFMENDAEVALALGHEWAHQLLGHPRNYTTYDASLEIAADCVGAFIAERAGYDAERGAASYLRMQGAERREALILAAVGVFGAGAKLDWNQRYASASAAHKASGGGRATKSQVEGACHVRLP